MLASRNLFRQCSRRHVWSSASFLLFHSSRNLIWINGGKSQLGSSCEEDSSSYTSLMHHHLHNHHHHPLRGWCRAMSSSKGRSMRSKVESRMRKESGKTLKEIRRAKKLKKKLMTDEERLIYNLKRAKKKVALLLQKLKKYELPELPSPVHDPELFTSEQLQAYKKIGFKNKNYVPVGVRGVFGGVVQNMHLHWKFHETVQVCCDNFPKEKIKEMAAVLARLSGGIVINIHNVKTIIMFRGRNYRQPKNLIPINTLTKRKALFKARFEQALESQKLNIKKIEQQLRRTGVNPEDPVAMASIQRVAATFFNAIDKKEGSPYVFQEDKKSVQEIEGERGEDSDQEELDKFIAEIEDAADREWAAEEAAEEEEYGRIRYWNREQFDRRNRSFEGLKSRNEMDARMKRRSNGSDDDDDEWGSDDDGDEEEGRRQFRQKFDRTRSNPGNHRENFRRRGDDIRARGDEDVIESETETMLSDLDNTMWDSEEDDERNPNFSRDNYNSSSDEDENDDSFNKRKKKAGKQRDEKWHSD